MNYFKSIIVVLLLVFSYSISSACEMKFKVLDNNKAKYNVGEELIVKLTVVLNHKNCSEGIGKTDLTPDGFKIVTATKWTETDGNVFERKVKLQVISNKKGALSLKAVRKCKKDGGSATLKLSANPI